MLKKMIRSYKKCIIFVNVIFSTIALKELVHKGCIVGLYTLASLKNACALKMLCVMEFLLFSY